MSEWVKDTSWKRIPEIAVERDKTAKALRAMRKDHPKTTRKLLKAFKDGIQKAAEDYWYSDAYLSPAPARGGLQALLKANPSE